MITGLVLAAATNFASREEDRIMANTICHAFHLANDDLSREIRWEDFVEGASCGEMKRYLEEIDASVEEARHIFNIIDSDGSGGLSALELVTGLMRLRGTAKAIDVALFFQRSLHIQAQIESHEERVESTVQRIYSMLRNLSAKASFGPPKEGPEERKATPFASPALSENSNNHNGNSNFNSNDMDAHAKGELAVYGEDAPCRQGQAAGTSSASTPYVFTESSERNSSCRVISRPAPEVGSDGLPPFDVDTTQATPFSSRRERTDCSELTEQFCPPTRHVQPLLLLSETPRMRI